MQRKVMISCAVTGSADTPGRNPAVPVTPQQIAQSAIDAAKAGAAIVHIHVRDPQTTRPSMDKALYREVVERIRASGIDVLINLTTGPGARFMPGVDDPLQPGPATNMKPPAQRVEHVMELKPDICSLDMGSMNMGGYVFVNTPSHLEAMAVPVFPPGGRYIEVDPSKLPSGTVIPDNVPPGHVTVRPISPQILKDAIIGKGTFPK